jgi:DNA-binding Lrp family transcriptional regulator
MQDALDYRLLNEFQRDFPLVDRPFAAVAARVGAGEVEVMARYARLLREGAVSRIGVVFRPHAAGASTLAAIAAPAGRLEEVAHYLGAQEEVNHNYEREHRFNLWFVLAAPTAESLQAAIGRIARHTGLPVLDLPLLEEFHIDLGFDLGTGRSTRHPARATARIGEADRPLVAALQEGFPLSEQPYAEIGRACGMDAAAVLRACGRWLANGVARRIGVVVRHRRLGFNANAMVVWDAPDADLRAIGSRMAGEPDVTLCYRRPRRPGWPYNLFCMIHGRERGAVERRIARLRRDLGIERLPHEVLFSRRCFTQRGARYAARASTHG